MANTNNENKASERQRILDAMSEQFMQPQITRKLEWIEEVAR